MNVSSVLPIAAACALGLAGCPTPSAPQRDVAADRGSLDAQGHARPAARLDAKPPAPPDAAAAPLVIEDYAPRALLAAAAPQVMAEVAHAHYDPERLGLRELEYTFRIEQRSRIGTTVLEGRGAWRAGSKPSAELSSVTRNGKPVPRDADDLGARAWTNHATQAQRLLHGLGAGFLRERIDQYAKAEGQVRKVGALLELQYADEEAGRTTLQIGKGHRVVRQVNIAAQGVTREMTYEHEDAGGRNLVTRAVLRVTLAKGNTVPRRAAATLEYADGMTYRIRYAPAGRFRLPVRIERRVTGTDDALIIALKHTRVVP
jgi:hypothetical protein